MQVSTQPRVAAPTPTPTPAPRSTPIGSVPPFYTAPATYPIVRDVATRAIVFANAVLNAGPWMRTISSGHKAGVWNALRTAGMQAQVAAHMLYKLRPDLEPAMQVAFDTGFAAIGTAETLDRMHFAGQDRRVTRTELAAIRYNARAVVAQALAVLQLAVPR